MTEGDLLGLLLVYLYVGVTILVSEKGLSRHPSISRKFLHIMVGNIVFILPFFETWWAMVFLAAFPFVILTFLMTPASPMKLSSRTTAAGHGFGLVYYSISWMVLAFLFFHKMEIIAVGILAMSYGDGMAAVTGRRFGKKKYMIFGEKKSLAGSMGLFIFTALTIVVAMWYYEVAYALWVIPATAIVAATLEACTPRGLDNLTVSLGSAFFFYAASGVVLGV